jgi:hypothetical protein
MQSCAHGGLVDVWFGPQASTLHPTGHCDRLAADMTRKTGRADEQHGTRDILCRSVGT